MHLNSDLHGRTKSSIMHLNNDLYERGKSSIMHLNNELSRERKKLNEQQIIVAKDQTRKQQKFATKKDVI